MDEERIAEIGERKHVGKETVNGYECDKYIVELKDQSQELLPNGFPQS